MARSSADFEHCEAASGWEFLTLLIGPVFTREAVTTPRRKRLYVYRSVYVAALFVLICVAWLMVAGTQSIRNVGDMARFGSLLFPTLAVVQLALVVFFSAFATTGAVAQEKDRRTLILLLMSRLTNSELVLGKLMASLLNTLVMAVAALPVFALIVLFGGVSFAQAGRVFAVTLTTALAAGSLGSTIALWREKTFQSLALTALALVFWLGVWEAVFAVGGQSWTAGFSPIQAILAAAHPAVSVDPALGPLRSVVNVYLVVSLAMTAVLNLIAIVKVRVWNPSREVRRTGQPDEAAQDSIWGIEHDLAQEAKPARGKTTEDVAEAARAAHVDARMRTVARKTRRVWDNPVLWREMRTWAYGKRVIVIGVAYLLLFAAALTAVHWTVSTGAGRHGGDELSGAVAPAAILTGAFFLVSLVIVNALAVTAITNERDGQALDLLLVTDVTPKEFIFGKLFGVFYVTKEMVLAPIVMCCYLWYAGTLSSENLLYVLGGLGVMYVFVGMLGVHCGMTYANSRTAISVSLGTVFFLFLGSITCILMMISFSGSFEGQFPSFLAFILGGGVGLYVSLGMRNPSNAIGVASLVVPFATFYAITSFMLGHNLTVFLVTVAAYGFTTAAMMIPAVYEFDVEMGRTSGQDEHGK